MTFKDKIQALAITFVIMSFGLGLFKFLPMYIWGADILFDASMHITTAMFLLYVAWFFIDQNKSWHTPFFIFCLTVITIISMQRILVFAHNDVGLLAGFSISLLAIIVSRWSYFKEKLSF
jgi:Ca2+/Na+ antiporter